MFGPIYRLRFYRLNKKCSIFNSIDAAFSNSYFGRVPKKAPSFPLIRHKAFITGPVSSAIFHAKSCNYYFSPQFGSSSSDYPFICSKVCCNSCGLAFAIFSLKPKVSEVFPAFNCSKIAAIKSATAGA